ncbi:transcriptional regulator, LysR family [Mucilaginibacter lappiensis]|uniref:DNA-binding transcriptional LysR family regulator n=1 Tax=Mucilaginibacter lappiensis TaxID=354630 RepID=A0ABR6PK67_9SPHI|nr:LysR family transcriptional regulator [Mucilaginibacter lappiensis]MBB6108631.1 DNA-binding transcriptional LysR family regulator [Mucilaginibacter lappiensis]SIQ30182.1 transcriptional regulator, LysR family [Mucilaginibacter lappiensis]
MHLQQIKYFLALTKELHFWNTAGKMNITQSALSRHIQSLERELGVQLFERNKRNVKLTSSGEFLKEKWEVKLNELEFIHQSARQMHLGESGMIRIAHPDSISGSIIPDIIARISNTFPKLQMELVQLRYENQQEFLSNYKIDFAITRDFNNAPRIRSEKIHSDHLSIVVPENHFYHTIEDLSKETLAQQKFILPIKNEDSSYSDIIQQMFRSFDVVPDDYLHSEFGSTTIALIRKGLGIAILPDSYMYHESPGLRFIRLPFKTDLFINWRADDHNPVLSNVLKLVLQ